MKKILLWLIFTSFVNAQDYKNIKISSDAILLASKIANGSNNSRLLNSENFEEENLFAVRFVPTDLTNEQYDKSNSTIQNQFLTILYRCIKTEKVIDYYILDSVTASYDVLFQVWIKNFAKDKKEKDNKNQRYFDKENKVMYYFSEHDDEKWKISCQALN